MLIRRPAAMLVEMTPKWNVKMNGGGGYKLLLPVCHFRGGEGGREGRPKNGLGGGLENCLRSRIYHLLLLVVFYRVVLV